MKAKVTVRLKAGVLDPQGKAILHAAHSLDCKGVKDVRVGKIFEIDLGESSLSSAQETLENLSNKLLANTVIETFEVEIIQ